MSLINDALKRAKQAQQRDPMPAADGPQLRPADADHNVRHGLGLALPIAFALVAILALFMVWRFAHTSSLPVAARSTAPAANAAAQEPSPAQSAGVVKVARDATPAAVVPPATVTATAEPVPAAKTGAPVAAVELAPIPAAVPVATAATQAAAAAPLKLQAIIFNPANPSALVSGKTLFLGDRVGQFRLVAVTQDTATLASLTATNTLALDE